MRPGLNWSSRIAICGLSLVVGFAPLPFGSTDGQIIAIWITLLALTTIFAKSAIVSGREFVFILLFTIIGCCWLVVVGLQLLPEREETAKLLNPIWAQTSHLIGSSIPGYISAVKDQPFFSAGNQIACALALLCGFLVGRNRICARALLHVFAISGLLYALYGIANLVISPTYVLWYDKVGYRYQLTATFINANTAAVYFGAVSVAWFLLMAEGVEKNLRPKRWRDIFTFMLRYAPPQTARHFVCFIITLSATFMTGSRLGSVLTMLTLCAAAAMHFRRLLTRPGAVLGFAALGIVTTLVLFQIIGGRVNQRFDANGLIDPARLKVYAATVQMIETHPWLGSGLGTFRWVFPAYRPSDISVVGLWDRAHNTTLELAAEMGLPFAAAVTLCWAAMLTVLFWGIKNRRRDNILPAVAFWSGFIAAVHSQLDFSLQIPGFAIVVLTLIGMGLAQSASSRGASHPIN